ncbi:Uncharacterised protein [Bacillus freudenreichii]|nr:Uncharacterised protein [Bacillus freudenreichii]
MYFEDEYMDEVEGASRRRRNRRNREKFVCECREVGSDRDWDHDCGCGEERGERNRDHDCHGDVGGRRDRKHHHDHCGCEERGEREERRNRCNTCVCNQLRKLQMGEAVRITTTGLGGSDRLNADFIDFNERTCCAKFMAEGRFLIVDCRDLKAIFVGGGGSSTAAGTD